MGQSGFVAVLVIDLHFPESESLKSKRKELSSIKAQLRTRLGAAVSEVAFQDLWQRARLTAALTGGSPAALESAAGNVERWLMARWPDNVRVERVLVSVDDVVEVELTGVNSIGSCGAARPGDSIGSSAGAELPGDSVDLAGDSVDLAGDSGDLPGDSGDLPGDRGDLAGDRGDLPGERAALPGESGEGSG